MFHKFSLDVNLSVFIVFDASEFILNYFLHTMAGKCFDLVRKGFSLKNMTN